MLKGPDRSAKRLVATLALGAWGFSLVCGYGQESSGLIKSTQAVPFEAGRLIYDQKKEKIYFEEGFKIERSTQSLTGRRMVYDSATGIAVATGSLVFQDPSITLKGNYLTFHVPSETAHWQNGVEGNFKTSLWRFKAKSLKGKTNAYQARGVRFTSCDRDHADYHVWAWRGKIWPGRKANFTHAFLHFGPIPFLYLPFYSKNLAQERLWTVYISPGQTGRDGKIARTVVAFPAIKDKLYTRMRIDYLSKTGVGFGPELIYRETDKGYGLLDLYTIREKPRPEFGLGGTRQWYLRSEGFYQIIPGLSAQGTFKFQRTPEFNSLYVKDHPERVLQNLQSSLALSGSYKTFQLRSFYSENWAFDELKKKFFSSTRVLPGLEGVVHPTKLWITPLYLQGNVLSQKDETKTAPDDVPFRKWSNSGNARLYTPWRSGLSFINGSLGGLFSTSHVSALSKINHVSIQQSRYGGEFLLRFSPWSPVDLALTYSHMLRSEIGSLRQDTKALDRGVNSKTLTVQEIGRFPLGGSLYARTAYEFPTIPGTRLIHWTQNLQPVWGSFVFSPLFGLGVNLSTSYEVFIRKYAHTVGFSQFVGRGVLVGMFQYNNRFPNQLLPAFIGNFYDFGPFEQLKVTWRGKYHSKTKTVLSRHADVIEPFDQEIMIVPKLHDFLITLVFRNRKEVREFFFTIRLKVSKQQEQKALEHFKEEEIRPWRDERTRAVR
ncbi:MAG: LPS-assembly protein LptD [Elusimicrobia bacterium]|nr:LPS-assembly protein LptD [Elusimicrobiota bacterium]